MLAPAPEPPSKPKHIYKPPLIYPIVLDISLHSRPLQFTTPQRTGSPSPFPKSIIHSFPAMNYYGERRAYDFYEEEDPYSTPRAGSFDRVDAVLPWRFEEPLPLPPPVPPKPKNDLKVRSAAALAGSSIPEPERIPERVTPWLLRRVKTPVTRATQTAPAPASQKASTDNIRGGTRTPKPEPPAYHAVPQQHIYPSQERLAITPTPIRGPATVVQTVPRTPPKPVAVAYRSASAARGGETQQRVPTPTPISHSGCPQIRSVRSAPSEERRSRHPATRVPLRPVAVQPERRVLLPSYHSAEPFPSSPAPPPYRASAEDSYPTSVRHGHCHAAAVSTGARHSRRMQHRFRHCRHCPATHNCPARRYPASRLGTKCPRSSVTPS
ncbi:hypothetical protein BGY98DRAFT_683805 [Russula aff. rugulosa BPL654]|nr:hypothetical protein BGY98DRAFT_683805 [Russula aff. rugulosa BPL654]